MKLKTAFTLIELLVVIAIIGILSGLIVVSMSGVTQKATIAKAQVFSNSLRNALMLNLVSEWKFDQINYPSNNQSPDTWSTNTATLSDATAACSFVSPYYCPQLQTTDCIFNNCLSLDGVDDYLSIANHSSLNMGTGDMTFSLWVNLLDQPTIDNSRFLFKIATSPLEGYNFAVNGTTGFLSGYIAESGTNVTVAANKTAIENNGWHYLVFSIDRDIATGLKLYIDGIQETYSTQNSPVVIPGDITTTTPLIIGRNNAGPANTYVKGKIDEVKIYNAAIPSSQIKEQYYAGLNSLLSNGGINKKEYAQKVNSLAISN